MPTTLTSSGKEHKDRPAVDRRNPGIPDEPSSIKATDLVIGDRQVSSLTRCVVHDADRIHATIWRNRRQTADATHLLTTIASPSAGSSRTKCRTRYDRQRARILTIPTAAMLGGFQRPAYGCANQPVTSTARSAFDCPVPHKRSGAFCVESGTTPSDKRRQPPPERAVRQ